MRTNELAKTTFVDDGECLSFHSFSSVVDSTALLYPGFELLVLPEGEFRLTVGGEVFAMQGPQVILLGPGLEHGWTSDGHFEGGLAMRWPGDLLGDGFLDKHQTKAIGVLLEGAALAVQFPVGVVSSVRQRLEVLRGRTGFTVYLDLLALLHELSLAGGEALLSVLPPRAAPGQDRAAPGQSQVAPGQKAEKKSPIDKVMEMMQTDYFRPMTLEEMARKACMSKGSFCRSFRKRTGKTYAESLNEIRLGHICRLLADTTDTVSEIAYRAGYQNIYHFHRHFKRQKGCTPLQWREGMRG